MNSSDTREFFRGRGGPDRQKDRGKYSGEDRDRDSRDRNARKNEKCQRETARESER